MAPVNPNKSGSELDSASTNALGVGKDGTKLDKKAAIRRWHRKNRAEMKKLNKVLDGLSFGGKGQDDGENEEKDGEDGVEDMDTKET